MKPEGVGAFAADRTFRTPVLGLLSFHRNGYVRQAAVRLLAAERDGTELPYLLIRQNDWVEPISRDARTAVEERLVDANVAHLAYNLPLIVRLSGWKRRDHSAAVQRTIELLVQPQHAELLYSSIRSPHRLVRRWVARRALDLAGAHREEIIRRGVQSDDSVIRLWSSRLVGALLADEEVQQIVGRLKQDSAAPVRSAAFWTAAQRFPNDATETWREALLDRSFSIRELARSQLAKLGVVDVAPLYREVLARNVDSLLGLLGLGETGNEADLPAIRRCLKAALPTRRREAIAGLARIGGESITGELIRCLQDDCRGVTREVQRLLEKSGRTLCGDELWAVVREDKRVHCRVTAIRLVFNMGKWRSLPWLIGAAVHPDANTASLAQQFIEAWFSPPRCNKVWTKPSPIEGESIKVAFSQFGAQMEPAFRNKLEAWLRSI